MKSRITTPAHASPSNVPNIRQCAPHQREGGAFSNDHQRNERTSTSRSSVDSVSPSNPQRHHDAHPATTMRLPLALLTSSSTTTALTLHQSPAPVPVPAITNISYWGSACPSSGLSYTFPPPANTTAPSNASTASVPLAFTLSNFSPTFSSFGSSLRMCNAVVFVAVDKGWKAVVNSKGTAAKGDAQVPEGARLYLRGSWAWAEDMGRQVRLAPRSLHFSFPRGRRAVPLAPGVQCAWASCLGCRVATHGMRRASACSTRRARSRGLSRICSRRWRAATAAWRRGVRAGCRSWMSNSRRGR
ncbi:hypothetical protein DPSP01_011795 [Paraphaeosphaeria sporulosa]|uniref:Uncharacterized protein n=1 Tax=Paraphaeosphaeria sporulosa TaxID=1460663 RepID=A0A177CHA8_9PLEO|nr:uncharacterized protein CC84DRAFT_761299 [Paraphaeosphaeria sporulosa]OAG06332.1 hypothetical protein CC84DRAFT_761299 [Paraphaeosphaeria sporulosa]